MQWMNRAGKPDPDFGTIRIKKRFLFLPKRIGDVWKWLEIAAWVERYDAYTTQNYVGASRCDFEYAWRAETWGTYPRWGTAREYFDVNKKTSMGGEILRRRAGLIMTMIAEENYLNALN